jgi:rod shape-determining protein MreD
MISSGRTHSGPVALLCLISAALLDLLPVPDASGDAPMPSLLLCALFAWSLARPSLLPPWSVCVVGIATDAVVGLPIGATAISLLAVRRFAVAARRGLLVQPPIVVWATFLLVALGYVALRWALVALAVGQAPPVRVPLLEVGLTAAVYPPVSALVGSLQRRKAVARAPRD